MSNHSFVDATILLQWLDLRKNSCNMFKVKPFVWACMPSCWNHPSLLLISREAVKSKQLLDTAPLLCSNKKKNEPTTQRHENMYQTPSFWGCCPCSMKTWGLFPGQNRKFWLFMYLSKCTRVSSVKNMVSRLCMCIPPWVKFWNYWQKRSHFYNQAISILDQTRCDQGAGANNTTYSVPYDQLPCTHEASFLTDGWGSFFDFFWIFCMSSDRLTTAWCVIYVMFIQKLIHNYFNCGVMNSELFTKLFMKLISCHDVWFCLQVTRYYAHTHDMKHLTLTYSRTLLLDEPVLSKVLPCSGL